MDRVKRIAGMAKGSSAVTVQKDEDESLVLFGELYKHEKEKDVNLLEPMYSVEFEAIQGDGRMFKLPSGKRDYILPDSEKHDYDWLKTPPATPLFRSLEMEANSTLMVFQRELPILQPIKTSRFSSKLETTSSSMKSESPTSSSSNTITPTEPPSSSSKKKPSRGAPVFSKEDNSAYRIDKRSSYTPLTNRKHNAVPSATTNTNTTTAKTTKKTSGKKPAIPASTNTTKKVSNQEFPDKAHKKITATNVSKARSKDPTLGLKDLKIDNGATRRLSCPPSATTGSSKELPSDSKQKLQDTLAPKGKNCVRAVPAASTGGRAAEAAIKGGRRMGGEKEQKPKVGSHAKNSG